MCDNCGCSTIVEHNRVFENSKTLALEEKVLSKNDRFAELNRGIFRSSKVFVVNMLSSPGAGKTTLLEQTIHALKGEIKIGVIEGDQQTDRDAKRIEQTGVMAHQISTQDACHLDAHMVQHAMNHFQLNDIDLLFIENVGNLICPSAFDLGEDRRVVVLSTTEGEDKPIKYPGMFIETDFVLINKVDLLPYLDIEVEKCHSFIKMVNPSVRYLDVSAKTGEGMDAWYEWIKNGITNNNMM